MPKASLVLIFAFAAALAAGQARVKSESLNVHERRDPASPVVKILKQGDEVVIEMSVTGPDSAQWCSIHELGQTDLLGYVPCGFLERPARTPARSTAPAQGAARQAVPAGGLSEFWDPLHRETGGEARYLGYAKILDATFKFSEQQKQQTIQIAIQNGIPACIEDSDSYFRRGVTPPDLVYTPGSPVTPCSWYFQYFIEQTFALITTEQRSAHRVSYDNFSREVAGNRTVIEARWNAQK